MATTRIFRKKRMGCGVLIFNKQGRLLIVKPGYKAASMFTIGSAVLPVTASLLTAARNVATASVLSKWALVAGAGCYAALVVAFVSAYRLAAWDTRPELAQWQEVTVGHREEEIQRWLGDAYVAAYQANVPQLRRKAALVGAALWLLAGEAASLTVAVLVPLFRGVGDGCAGGSGVGLLMT